MRFIYLTTLYPSYVEAFYKARPGLESRSYDEQKAALDRDAFAWNGALEIAMPPLGYIVQSIYANVLPLQKAWADEHGVSWPHYGWIEELPLKQLQFLLPDILWVDALAVYRYPWIKRAREICYKLRLVMGFAGVDLHDRETIRACDAMFSCARGPVDYFTAEGANAFLFRHAFNPAILDQMPPVATSVNELLFTGSIARDVGAHLERERLIEALVGSVPISIHCPECEISYLRDLLETNSRRGIYVLMRTLRSLGVNAATLRRIPKFGAAIDWRVLPMSQINTRLYSQLKPPLYGIDMFTAMRDHSLTLNKHIDMARTEAGNSRLFEATGAGACLLTDWKGNLTEMFEPDIEVAVYRCIEECVEKARWLLGHPEETKSVAKAAQARVLREHTFAHRATDLDRLIKAELL